MKTINGSQNFAHIMANEIDETTESQIQEMLNCPAFKGSQIRVMADTHAGKGSVVGFTATLGDQIIPNVVGVDIGCGIEAYKLDDRNIDFQALDNAVRESVPSGFSIHNTPRYEIFDSVCAPFLFGDEYDSTTEFMREVVEYAEMIFDGDTRSKIERMQNSLGTLGGGNHFIEIDRDADGCNWLLLHSGSRNFGLQVCNYFQAKARELMEKFFIADQYKYMEFLPMDLGGQDYLDAMRIAQKYAVLNRHLMAKAVIEGFFGLDVYDVDRVKTVHNYINFDDGIIRKGAISAHEGEKVLIPINMRDGVILGTGKGSQKWNCSAPHGAGRVLSRKKARESLSLTGFQETMEGVWTSCVSEKTLDESPMAYKSIDFILESIGETVNVDSVIKPVYNFKAN